MLEGACRAGRSDDDGPGGDDGRGQGEREGQGRRGYGALHIPKLINEGLNRQAGFKAKMWLRDDNSALPIPGTQTPQRRE